MQNSYNPTPMSQAKSCPLGERSTRQISSGLNNYEQDQSPCSVSKAQAINARAAGDQVVGASSRAVGEELSVAHGGGVMLDIDRRSDKVVEQLKME